MQRRLPITLLLISVLVIPLAAYAHTYIEAPLTEPCTDNRFCAYMGDDYTGSEWETTSGEVDTWPEPWYASENSAYSEFNTVAVRIYNGENQTGGFYCLPANRGIGNLPFHHQDEGKSHKTFNNC